MTDKLPAVRIKTCLEVDIDPRISIVYENQGDQNQRVYVRKEGAYHDSVLAQLIADKNALSSRNTLGTSRNWPHH